ncbi:hypothetical protein NECID01_0285 [Nematocida sp. AWRm77]|nr:hypothetical protein NECID01_0285 [Nematocida sp. AWRm77]
MLAHGLDTIVTEYKQKVFVYQLSKGMEMTSVLRAKNTPTALGCCPQDRFVLVGCANGSVWMHRAEDLLVHPEHALESGQLVCRMSLCATSIYITGDIVYVSSEDGTIKVLAVEKAIGLGTKTRSGSEKESLLADTEEGWMKPMESAEEEYTETESYLPDSSAKSTELSFRTLREIKHTTPIVSIAVCGPNIYALDMRGRVKVFPSKVVYDHVSMVHFNKYLFCADGNTVFTEIGQTFTSVYFAKASIREIQSSRHGGYLFLLTEQAMEILCMESMGGVRRHACSLPKGTEHIAVDSERSILYGIVHGKPQRLEIDYVWIDRPMCDLQIKASKIEKVVRSKDAERGEDPFFDIPMPKHVRDMPIPPAQCIYTRDTAHADSPNGMNMGAELGLGMGALLETKHRDKTEHRDSLLSNLFEEEGSEGDEEGVRESDEEGSGGDEGEGAISKKKVWERVDTSQFEIAHTKRRSKYPECTQNTIVGSVFCMQESNILAYWSSECRVIASLRQRHGLSNTDTGTGERLEELDVHRDVNSDKECTEVEITVRDAETTVSLLEVPGRIELCSGSKDLVCLYSAGVLRVFRAHNKLFLPSSLLGEYHVQGIERVACGEGFFCIVQAKEIHSELAVYTAALSEVFSLSGRVRGLAASRQFFGVAEEKNGGICLSLYTCTERRAVHILSLATALSSIDAFSVSTEGVMVVESCNCLYAVGPNRLVRLKGAPLGLPLGLAMNYVIYAMKDASGTLSLFPECTSSLSISKECLLKGGVKEEVYDIHALLAEEIASKGLPEKQSSAKQSMLGGHLGMLEAEDPTLFTLQKKPRERERERKAAENIRTVPSTEEERHSGHSEEYATTLHTPTKKIKSINPFART